MISAVIATAACSGPLAPGALAPVPQTAGSTQLISNPANPLSPSRVVSTFLLADGSFTLQLRTGDGATGSLSGTYTGKTASTPGNTTAALDLAILSREGIGASVSGINAEGSGAYLGEGAFTLTLSVSSTIKSVDGSVAKATLRGTSQISCPTSGRIRVTQHGTDSTPRFAEITVDMHHEIGNTGCGTY